MADVVKKTGIVRDFSRVIITLDNTLVPEEKLSTTPSMLDGLNYETEIDLRILGCELIQTSGILLKLPQVAMATGQVLYQRFYYSKSFIKHSYEVVAMACINLASKIEEAPRRIRDVINVFHHIKQIRNKKTIGPLVLDQNYINLKNQVIKAERRVLKELGFCVHVKHPHKIIVLYLEVLEAAKNQRLVQLAWNYMNDSFRSNVFVRFHPETIACACIYLAARQLQIPLPSSPAWYGLFGATDVDIQQICRSILRLYTRRRPNVDDLESVVNNLKKSLMESKLKSKEPSAVSGATPTIASRSATPDKSPLSRPEVRRILSDDEKSDSSFGKDIPIRAAKKRTRSRSNSNSRHQKSQSNERDKPSRTSPAHRPVASAAVGNSTNNSSKLDHYYTDNKIRRSQTDSRHRSSAAAAATDDTRSSVQTSRYTADVNKYSPVSSRHGKKTSVDVDNSPRDMQSQHQKRSRHTTTSISPTVSHKHNGQRHHHHRSHRRSRSKEQRHRTDR